MGLQYGLWTISVIETCHMAKIEFCRFNSFIVFTLFESSNASGAPQIGNSFTCRLLPIWPGREREREQKLIQLFWRALGTNVTAR